MNQCIVILPSKEADAKLPFGRPTKIPVKPESKPTFNVLTNIPLVVFHILIVKSSEPDAKLPFGNVANV
jgi:hypothetical protein